MTLFSQRPLLLSLACCLTLTACDDDRIHNICSQYPALCADLVDDGWCRYERSDVIRGRYYLQEEGTDRRKYDLMRGLERYLQCAEHSTNIEYKRAREQKSPRVEGMLAAGDQLAQLDVATRNLQDPYLLLWHWTNNTNELARQQFLALGDGDSVALAGSLTPKVWTDKEGQQRPGLDMQAHQVLTVYQMNKKRHQTRDEE